MPQTAKTPAKYADKPAVQPDLVLLFDQLKKILSKQIRKNYVVKADKEGHYEISYNKEVEMAGKRYPEVSFASLLIQKGYVGFYFFPVYPMPDLREQLSPALLKCLKGKTCFHIKKEDPVLFEQIDEALETGYEAYSSKGWN